MAGRTLYGRLVGGALVAGPLVIGGIGWAGPAQADQTSFLNDLHNANIHAINGGDDALLQMGADLCQQLSWGASPTQLEGLALQRSDADQGNGGINGRQAADVVIFALRDLCPNA
ncbi:hypothetical protein A5714_02285 [Mycobacterium sp. E2462]|uniref:DUF732 domain-containing protein n=1 Tax=unclassified Mycobacterium TaxID=2642494 RepID=UPI0007FF3DCA|nr:MULTISPECIES: DUF732 domain-containing protein [unclassified Mycobacterium]OBG76431.1 hypothetical protein A5700_21720 [Mycobacterium sp. E1214]OBH24476.1 hypothetical protein A5693_07960 [Mycobacterium sp. E1319]OBI06570.1 hypothetical protein A5714_02285 [Mycobacterium sp. E2462]